MLSYKNDRNCIHKPWDEIGNLFYPQFLQITDSVWNKLTKINGKVSKTVFTNSVNVS